MRVIGTVLLACAGMPLLAQVSGAPAETASPVAAAGWGMLGDMAGQDFEGKNFFVTVRWVEPGERLQFDVWTGDWSGNFRYRYEFVRNAEAGGLDLFHGGRKKPFFAQVGSGGSIAVGHKQEKLDSWLSRSEDGTIEFANRSLRPLDPAGKRGQRLAKLIAEGRIAPSGTLASAAAPQLAATPPANNFAAATDAAVLPGGVMTDAQRSGLEGYVGKTYALIEGGKTVGIQRLHWVTPGSEIESVSATPFNPGLRALYKVADDGRITVEAAEFSGHGQVDAAGLPALEYTQGSQAWRTRTVAAGPSYQETIEQNVAKPGKKPKWKLARTLQSKPIDEREAARLSEEFRVVREERWAPFTHLIEKPQFCIQYEPGWLLTRKLTIHRQFGRPTNRTYPVLRLTSGRWIEPWQVMEVTSTLGERKMVDRVTLLSDGSFRLLSTGVDAASDLRGSYSRVNYPSNGGYTSTVRFPVAVVQGAGSGSTFNTAVAFAAHNYQGKFGKRTTTFEGWGYGASGCDFEPYDAAKSDAYLRQFADASASVR